METNELTQFRYDLKNHLLENDGELVYWGELIRHSRMSQSSRYINEINVGTYRQQSLWSGTGIQDSKTKSIDDVNELDSRLRGNDERLETLRANTIGDCHLCPLGDTRIKLVFGIGNPEADVMFIGEGPGFEEDRQGEPFVGKAGQLLDKIIGAIGLDRTKVYIANMVKCHPMTDPAQPDKRGNDRPPSPEEMEKCRPFLMEQIRIIRPKIIVTLGGVSTKALLNTSRGITALRGNLVDLEIEAGLTVKVLPTFHPAALLRDESLKKAVWEDMKQLRGLLSAG